MSRPLLARGSPFVLESESPVVACLDLHADERDRDQSATATARAASSSTAGAKRRYVSRLHEHS